MCYPGTIRRRSASGVSVLVSIWWATRARVARRWREQYDAESGASRQTTSDHPVGADRGIVKLRLTAVSDPQHGGFTAGSSPASWGSSDELFVNLTVPPGGLRGTASRRPEPAILPQNPPLARESETVALWRHAHITLTRTPLLGSYDRAARGPNHGRCSPSGLSHQHGSSDMGVRGGQRLRASIRASMRTLPVRCLPGRAPIALRNQA